MTFSARIAGIKAALLLLSSCFAPQRSLAISLEETPLYPERQWAVVNMSYTKVSGQLAAPESSLGMVSFGNIVEVQRIERKDDTVWAFILWQPPAADPEVTGWVPYSFLHLAGNRTEAELVSRRLLQNPASAID